MGKAWKRITTALASLAMALGVGGVISAVTDKAVETKATEEVYKTALFGSTYNSKSVSDYTSTWTATNDGFAVSLTNFNNNSNSWDYVKCGRKNNASVGTITTSSVIDKAITKVVVTVDAVTTAKVNSQKLYVATDSDFASNLQTITVAAGTGDNTFTIETPTANCYYKLEWDCASGSSNGLVTISKIEYYYDNVTKYSVTYNDNGAVSGSVPTDANTYAKDASVTVLGNTGSLAKTNYDFTGWNTSSDGTGDHYDAGDTFEITANTTLYAEWVDNRVYYDITESSDHLSLSGKTHVLSGDDVGFDNSEELFLVADAKWNLPSSITVTGAGEEDDGWTYNSSTGEIVISEVTGNITVTGTAVAAAILGIEVEVDSSETSFYLGHEFTHDTAVVTATYDDAADTEEDVTDGCTWSSPDMFTAGNGKTITVTHTASGETDTYTIDVVTKVLRSLSYTKVTASRADWSGTYVIANSSYMMGSTISSNRVANTTVPTVSEGKITSTVTDAMKWQIAKVTGGYTIRNVSTNAYLAATGTNNQAALPTSTGTYTTWTISYSSGFTITNTGMLAESKNAVLRNNGTYGWASYGGSTGDAPELYEYLPALTKELIKITASVKDGTYYIGDAVTASDFNVTAYYDDGTNASVTATSLTNASLTSTSNTVTVNYTEGGITKSANVVVAAEVRAAELESLTWSQAGLAVFDGDELDFSELATITANYDDDSSSTKNIEDCSVGLYSKVGEVYTKEVSISDGHVFDIAEEDGLYLGISYEENEITAVAYSSTPITIVETLDDIYQQIETTLFTTKATSISVGDRIVIAAEGTFGNQDRKYELSGISDSIGTASTYSTNPAGTMYFDVVAGNGGSGFAFKNGSNYLQYTGSGNTLTTSTTLAADTSWTVSFDGTEATITNVNSGTRVLQFNYNNGNPRYAAYTSSQVKPCIYKGVAGYTPSGDSIANTNAVVQKEVIAYARLFNTTMACVSGGTTENIDSKWTSVSSAFTTSLGKFTSSNLIHFKALFAYAYSEEGGDVLQDMLARYDYIVNKYGKADFLHSGAERPEAANFNTYSFEYGIANLTNSLYLGILIATFAIIGICGGAIIISKRRYLA